MADSDVNLSSDSPNSAFEEVNIPADSSNYSDGEIIDSDWHFELESVLNEGFVDQGIIKSVCKCRNIPEKFRSQVWKICLNVASRGNPMKSWDGKYDPATEDQLKADCLKLVSSLTEDDFAAVNDTDQAADDAMAVITFYCKCRAIKYSSSNGWSDILRPLLHLSLSRGDLYNCFYAIQSRYVSRIDISPQVSQAPYHLLRLLLLYHDPEMCNYLDTCKISTESFSKRWFSTLFSSHCPTAVVSAIWDVYLQQSDSFFVFFLALVILVNAKEQVMATIGATVEKEETITTLANSPSVLAINDVDDFCQLALYYSDRTPASFRRDLGACFYSSAMASTSTKLDAMATELGQSFCLKVSIPELLLSSQPSYTTTALGDENGPRIRFFVVDCRPAELYNKGHLLTAFHLDATLMLREPTEFDAALSALFTAQEQAMQAGSAAGGEHLCFIGSGNEEEDQYMYMVVANLLQKHQTYVSVARGGYVSLLEYLTDVGIDLSEWIVGAERPPSNSKAADNKSSQSYPEGKTRVKMESLMKKMAGNVYERTMNLREKVVKFIETTDDEWEERERSSRPGKKSHPGGASVFSIGDENEHEEEESAPSSSRGASAEYEPLSKWKNNPDTKQCFQCQAVQPDGRLVAAHLLVTFDTMRCLVEVDLRRNTKQTWVRSLPPRLLCSVVKITSRRSFPELITFKFGDLEEMDKSEEAKIIAADRYILPDAGGTTRTIKQMIVEADEKRQAEKKVQSPSEEPGSSEASTIEQPT